MLRQVSGSCPCCEVKLLLGATTTSVVQSQQHRLYTQAQHGSRERTNYGAPKLRNRFKWTERDAPRPNHMVLSNTVAQPVSEARTTKKPAAFGHLNRTEVPTFLRRPKGQREQPQIRSTRATNSRFQARRDDKKGSESEPFHALKMQESLAQIPYSDRTVIKRKIEEYDSFDKFPLLDSVMAAIDDALPGLEYRKPTPAQAVAMPSLLGMEKKLRAKVAVKKQKGLEAFLLAAETGSGKTLAYLLPVLDAIKREEFQQEEKLRQQAQRDDENTAQQALREREDIFAVEEPALNKAVDPGRPRAIILVPSAELVAQVGAVVKSLSHTIKIRAARISAKMSATVIRNQLFQRKGVDIIISTPPLLHSIVQTNPNILARVTHLVCDEADSLFDRSFKPSTSEIIARATPSLKKIVLCSATIPKYLDKHLYKQYPNMQRIVTPNLHAIPRRIQLAVVDVNKDPYRGNKMLACADTIWQIGKASADYDPDEGKAAISTKHVLVFVNERENTEEVAAYLVKKGIDALAFHRDTDPLRQTNALGSFTSTESAPRAAQESTTNPSDVAGLTSESDSPAAPLSTLSTSPTPFRTLPNTKVIVTTDLGSRGIDTVAVRHVILYDVPHTTIDFIHRLGRTGRMGRRGRGIVLVGAGDRADVVREVRDAMFRGEALI